MRHQRGKGGSWLGSGFPRAVPTVMLFIKTSVRKWKLPDRRGLGLHINKGDTRKITWPRGDQKYYIYQRSTVWRPHIRFISCCCSCQFQKCLVRIVLNCFTFSQIKLLYNNILNGIFYLKNFELCIDILYR
jgi:hypothetical protein